MSIGLIELFLLGIGALFCGVWIAQQYVMRDVPMPDSLLDSLDPEKNKW
jgi:hypothetical protein